MALTQVKSDGIADGAVTTNDLSDSGVTAGTYGSSSAIPAITVDAKGRITSASTNSINIDSTSISNGTSNVSVAASGDITLTRAGTTQATVIGGGLKFGDNKRAYWGDDTDLQIWHDGSNSHIKDNGTGNLIIEARNLTIRDISGENHITADVNSSVNLFHDNSQKLSTTSSGINVTGTVTCDGLTCEGDLSIRSGYGTLLLRDTSNSGTGAQTRIVFEDSTGHTQGNIGYLANNNNDLYISNEYSTNLVFRTGGATRCFVDSNGYFNPAANNTFDLGTSSLRWRNIYTNDLNLSNEGGTNDVDGTWGSWTIQEGEDDLFLLNRRNGKKYKFNLSEVN